jgi:hypothetical protein
MVYETNIQQGTSTLSWNTTIYKVQRYVCDLFSEHTTKTSHLLVN